MGVKQWCNTCNAQVEGANACTWEMCPLNRDDRTQEQHTNYARIKEIKCTTCGQKYPWELEKLELAANTCKYRHRTDYQACKIKQWSEFLASEQGKPKKQQIALLLQGPHNREQKKSQPPVNFASFDVDIPDVLCIRINKKGHVHVSKEQ